MASISYGAATESENVSLYTIYNKLNAALTKAESNLTADLAKLNDADDISQAELLNIQTRIQAWGNICSTITGLMRAVGDSLKSTTQNIR